MKKRYFATTPFILPICTLLVALIAIPSPAIKEAAITELNGGKQIWIKTVPPDRAGVMLVGDKGAAKEIAAKAPVGLFGGPETFIISLEGGGFMEWDFEWARAEEAWIQCHVFDLRGGGQSWFFVLNSKDHEVDGLIIDTHGPWSWSGRREGDLSPTKLKKGLNVARVVPREAVPGDEPLMDMFVLSNVEYKANDKDFFCRPRFAGNLPRFCLRAIRQAGEIMGGAEGHLLMPLDTYRVI